MRGGEPSGGVTYVEPCWQYFDRKYFVLSLDSLALVTVVLFDAVWPWGTNLLLFALFHFVFIGLFVALLIMHRNVMKFQRFRIFEDGFWLPGSRPLPGNRRLVRFNEVGSIEFSAMPHRSSLWLQYVTVKLKPDSDATNTSTPREIVVDGEAFGRKNLHRLVRELANRRIITEDSYQALRQTK